MRISVRVDGMFDEPPYNLTEDWVSHLILALPVATNQGIWFNETSSSVGTVVNLRDPAKGWMVSFRDKVSEPDRRHYHNPRDAARAVIEGKHNERGTA